MHDALVFGAEHYSHHSMFDSVSKIAGVIRKRKGDPDKTKWAFCMMLDRVVEGYSTVGEMSNALLFGTKEKRGTIDVILELFDIKDHLLFTALPALQLDPQVAKALQTNYCSVAAYRSKVPRSTNLGGSAPGDSTANGNGGARADLSWMASWSLSKKKLATFFEDILFKNVYERQVKQLVVNKQSASELMGSSGVIEEWGEIKKRLNAENGNTVPESNCEDNEELGGSAPAEDDALMYIPPDADELAVQTIRKYQDHARTLIEQSVTIIVETTDEANLARLLRQAHETFKDLPVLFCGQDRRYDVGVYDVKLAGESVTHPHLRIVGYRSEHYCKLIRAFLRSQLPPEDDILNKENMPDGPLVVTLDGGKFHGQGPCQSFLSDRRWLCPPAC